jgi:hypothetical protein
MNDFIYVFMNQQSTFVLAGEHSARAKFDVLAKMAVLVVLLVGGLMLVAFRVLVPLLRLC